VPSEARACRSDFLRLEAQEVEVRKEELKWRKKSKTEETESRPGKQSNEKLMEAIENVPM
jgi:hypothetical protein